MIKECKAHGYFRAESCPVCRDAGKFLMNDEEVDVRSIVDAVRARRNQFHWLRSHHIRALAATDPKGRYQVDVDRVRATYGHSLDLDLDLPTDNIPGELYYPATEEEVGIILETGLKPSDRKYVHLSLAPENAADAGSHRTEKPVILKVDAKGAIAGGAVIKRAGHTVFITKEIPAEFLARLER